ncbi:glycosyltransferase family 2 protein [Mucilaginibacter myungsuensis]|uniref:Glycosyltransferase family 2 protein n=1 Tax=Mucilaginibacter myungsuensis TaxID=649104 RepID=A0A929KZM1_9SPHI|nr:glycosyltransferase family 2 protein [Mucilaginibacter myungsuensis]MBE9664122.1 glycosyltransferase family 2 protein [Mucilaginibacter myungsuensis]MDN3601301.1 glycosyltransferase family 2 protein [Mucilaginibacter myungsuensis]
MNNSALVSIIIPTYNREAILPSAIESALAQTYTNTQIIVVDDGSVDNTAEMIKKYPQVEYHIIEHGGQAAARNRGLEVAKGEFITTLDSDDVWQPEFLSTCVPKMQTDDLDLCFANWIQNSVWDKVATEYLTRDTNIRPFIKPTEDGWVDLTYPEARLLYITCCPSPSSSLVLRRTSIVGRWNKDMIIGDDWCMCLGIILSKQCKVSFTITPLWEKKIDSKNIYDGRQRAEVLKYLYVHDLETMLKKYKLQMRKREIFVFQKLYMEGAVELAKHEALRGFNFVESAKLLSKAFRADVPYTLKMIPYIMLSSFRRKMEQMKANRQ